MTTGAASIKYEDYTRFSRLVRERFGLHFPESRREELEWGLQRAFAASTCVDLDEYYRLLTNADHNVVELDRLVNALTVCETHFFRDAGQFDALYNHIFPEIIERRRAMRTMRIWSAGCATGAEPYSIAIMLCELLPDIDDWTITILGTDVNTEALDRARKGIYNDWAFREERAKAWRPRYFRTFNKGQRHELIPEVRRMVKFARLNLANNCYPAYESNTVFMDLIICRNVTIYLAPVVTSQVVERFYNALVDGGWLVVGHAEPSLLTYRRFQTRNFPHAILYQRTGQPTALSQDWDWLSQAPKDTAQPLPPPPEVPAPPITPPITQLPEPPPASPAPQEAEPRAAESIDTLEQARDLLDYGHSVHARDLLLRLIQNGERRSLVHTLLGKAYANLGSWQEAERWCRRAIRTNRLDAEAYYTLALVLQHQGELDAAINATKKVLYIERNNLLAHFGLANLYRDNGQLSQARKSLANARRLLEERNAEELIPGSGGVTVGRLLDTVVRQQEQ